MNSKVMIHAFYSLPIFFPSLPFPAYTSWALSPCSRCDPGSSSFTPSLAPCPLLR